MKNQVFNPYLPSWEYVPDGEPHVFGDRVYVYGSHDSFGAPIFCVNDYVCWSAPVNDLSDWRYEGIIYRKKQDPSNPFGIRSLYAPDVTKGPDGRYYLYYAFDFMGTMGVAVCDTPAGQYEYYGKVHHKDGKVWGRKSGEQFPFDPGVLTDDDGRIWLYSGFATKVPFIASRGHNLKNDGGVVIELEQDMVTIKQEPKLLFPIKGRQGAFKDHAFFEASSIRKINGKYYFVYSSEHNHDLCYAVSDRPDGGFTYGGVLVDLGDLFLDNNTDESHANNYLGNTHGGLLYINNELYIFYHRQTNRSSYARQACAEKLRMKPDGTILQSEVTSCGLNPGPLRGKGKYEARIACNLWAAGHSTGRVDGSAPKKRLKDHPYFTQSGKDRNDNPDQFIANMSEGATAGFKYFIFDGTETRITVRGNGRGEFSVTDGCKEIARVPVNSTQTFCIESGIHPLYFIYRGTDTADFLGFEIR
ncbi:MAG: family 43 glycosylhydrolase [Parasporobacterium sp.]|nr:family 43 glycosylhydrolase [Parasporobacterium sp.]